jgi:hypothetical protein
MCPARRSPSVKVSTDPQATETLASRWLLTADLLTADRSAVPG